MGVLRSGSLAFVTILLLAGCNNGGQQDNGNDDEKDDAPPVPVEVGAVTRGDIFAVYKGTAPIEALAEADVIAKVAGEVREILVEEGDEVVKGQVLARLDGDRLRLELNESRARLDKLKRDYERNVDLNKKGLISTGDFEKIRYEMDALQATYNLARLELDYTQIRAPIDGVVSIRYIKLGNTLAANEPAFRVTSIDPLVAYLHVPEREFRNIKPGQHVSLSIDALHGDPVQASVTRVSPIVDPVTGTFKTTIEISDSKRRIKPGMFARIGVVYDQHSDALLVPRSAIVEDVGQEAVFVVEDGIAKRKLVSTGFSSDGKVEILSGLHDADAIITVGQIGLKPDVKVEIINAAAEAAARNTAADMTDAAEDKD